MKLVAGVVLVFSILLVLGSASSRRGRKTKLMSSLPVFVDTPKMQDFREQIRKMSNKTRITGRTPSYKNVTGTMISDLAEEELFANRSEMMKGRNAKKGRSWKKEKQFRHDRLRSRKYEIKMEKKMEANFSEFDNCENLMRKFDFMCNSSSYKFRRAIWKSIRLHPTNKQGSSWKSCCSLESDPERMKCFNNTRLVQLDAACKNGNSKLKTKKCCWGSAETRLSCFDAQKQKSCNDMVAKKTQTMKGNEVTKKEERMAKMCCNTGHMIRNHKNTTAEMCTVAFAEWASKKKNLHPFCAAKFIYCCTHVTNNMKETGRQNLTYTEDLEEVPEITKGRKHKGFGKRGKSGRKRHNKHGDKWIKNIKTESGVFENITYPSPQAPVYPDETGQMIEETMEMLKYMLEFVNPEKECCAAGVNRTLALDGAVVEECLAGQEEFSVEWPHIDEECSNLYIKCCMKPEILSLVGDSQMKPPKKERAPEKGDFGGRYRDKNGKLPDGMRMSPSGHYYYIDRALPQSEVSRTMQRPRKVSGD